MSTSASERARNSRVDEVTPWHRGFALLAVISLLIGTRGWWTDSITVHPALTAVFMAVYGAILTLAVLTLVAPSLRAMVAVDAAILVTAVVRVLAGYVVNAGPADVGAFAGRAATALLAGEPVYGAEWPEIFDEPSVGLTKTMDGGGDYVYAYPPLAPLLTAAAIRAAPFLEPGTAATATTTGALILGGIALWVLLPAPWRSAGTAVTLGYPLLPNYAANGYPAIIAMALLIPVVVAWPATGAGGRVGRSGIVRAILLGAACCAQQLAWFVVPFLLVGLHAVRRPEVGGRNALAVVARFVAIAAATFLAINAWFALRDGTEWLAGILLPVTQHAVPHGQGLIGISYYLVNGSGALDFYSYAALLFAIALVGLSVLFMRTLGVALTVLPWAIFFLAIRSQDGYYLLMTPLWLAAAATVPRATVARAWEPRVPGLWGRRRAVLAAALVAPAIGCLAIAIATPAPLRMDIVAADTRDEGGRGVWRLEVEVENRSGSMLVPHFALSANQSMSAYWRQEAGPTELGPNETARYILVAQSPDGHDPGNNGYLMLRAVTDGPQTLSSVPIDPGPEVAR